MGLFSRGPSLYESFGYAIQAFGMSVIQLSEDERAKIQSVACGAVESYINAQSWEVKQKQDLVNVYRVISGSVGVSPSKVIDAYGKGMEIDEIIETSIPTNMPMVVMGPIRMVIEEHITSNKLSEINYEKFDGSPARILVNALMHSLEIINTRCIQDPKGHNSNEVMCFSGLARFCSEYARVLLPLEKL